MKNTRRNVPEMSLNAPGKLSGHQQLFHTVAGLIDLAKRKIAGTINVEMVVLYWNIGKTIIEINKKK